MDMKLELIIIPVTDVDEAKAFYVDRLGFADDWDVTVDEHVRFVQLTPQGSACSIAFGKGLTEATPGSVRGMQMVIADADAAHAELTAKGVQVGPVDEQPWGRFVTFTDPDGNAWSLQQMPDRS